MLLEIFPIVQKISIITTCLNRTETIKEAVCSVMRQTYSDIEHIIIDGGSTDDTLTQIESCGSDRIAVLVSEKDKGAYEALNKGVRRATGDIIGWLHSDDFFYDQHVLEDIVRVFETTGCDMLYGNGLFVSPQNYRWVIRDWVSGPFSNSKMRNGWLPLHTTVFVRKEVFERYGYYREDYQISSDTDWLLRCMFRTDLKKEYFNRYIVVMRYGGLSTSWSKTFLRWREDLGIYYQQGVSPRWALFKKIIRKLPQFLSAPFAKLSVTSLRHMLHLKHPKTVSDKHSHRQKQMPWEMN